MVKLSVTRLCPNLSWRFYIIIDNFVHNSPFSQNAYFGGVYLVRSIRTLFIDSDRFVEFSEVLKKSQNLR